MPEIKIRINSDGYLWMRRKNDLKIMVCPFCVGIPDHPTDPRYCGHWCPHFSEPTFDPGCEINKSVSIKLSCGDCELFCDVDEFEDLR